MDLTHKDIDRILKIIDESGYDEVNLEVGDFKLHVRKAGSGSSPTASAAAAPSTTVTLPILASAAVRGAPVIDQSQQQVPVPEGLVAVRSPMLGTFFRAPSPGAKSFVEVGDKVKAADTVCLVEVMKLFNSVRAGVDGTVVKILAENASLVEYEQALILIEHDLVNASGQTE